MLRGLRQPRRVVITGMGCVTPLGVGRASFWSALRRGESGIRRIEGFDVSRSPVQIAGQVVDFDWEAELKPKDRRHVARTVPLALASAREAMSDAGLHPSDFSIEEQRAFGIVLGEGAWVYVLEEYERARARGARVYAEVTGYGATCDAYHRVRLEDTGEEPARAMRLALEDAGRAPEEVDYVNLHGTSTVLNDRIETQALKLALGEASKRIPMSGTKSQIGHPQGASGAAGGEPAPECDLDYTPNHAREREVRVALCNCIGFGSKNSALVVERPAE